MSAHPEYRFKCNRCYDETTTAMPAAGHGKMEPPEGWTTLIVGNPNDASTPVQHLCPPCAFGLTAYVQGAAVMKAADLKLPA